MTKVEDEDLKGIMDIEILRCDCTDKHYGELNQFVVKGDPDYGYVTIGMMKEPQGSLWTRIKDAWLFIVRRQRYWGASMVFQKDGLKELQSALNRYVERVEKHNEST